MDNYTVVWGTRSLTMRRSTWATAPSSGQLDSRSLEMANHLG